MEKMLLEEKITKKENGEIEFQVTLTISSTEEHILVLDTEKIRFTSFNICLAKARKKRNHKCSRTAESGKYNN